MQLEIENIYSEEYLVLNFEDKIDPQLLKTPNLFFKIVNLSSKIPLIQIGKQVYQGKYNSDSLGTSLIFQSQKPSATKKTAITTEKSLVELKYLTDVTKQLTLTAIRPSEEAHKIDDQELVDLEFNETLEEILRKIENGTIDYKTIIKKPSEIDHQKTVPTSTLKKAEKEKKTYALNKATKKVARNEKKVDKNDQDISKRSNLLGELANPQEKLPQYCEQLDFEAPQENFKILKELYLKSIDFSKIKPFIDEKDHNIEDFVDLEASIRDEIIVRKNPSDLSDEDMQKLISFENFDNLSLQMKIVILTVYLKDEKCLLQIKDEDITLDAYGRTPKMRYKLLKSLVKDLQYNFLLSINKEQ